MPELTTVALTPSGRADHVTRPRTHLLWGVRCFRRPAGVGVGFGRPDAACAGLGPRAHASTWLARAVMSGTLAAVGSLLGSAPLFTGVLSGITFRTHQVDGD